MQEAISIMKLIRRSILCKLIFFGLTAGFLLTLAGRVFALVLESPIESRLITQLPANSVTTLPSSSTVYRTLEMSDGSVIDFAPTIGTASVTIGKLVLNGKCTIDLTPQAPMPLIPGRPSTPPQATVVSNSTSAVNGT